MPDTPTNPATFTVPPQRPLILLTLVLGVCAAVMEATLINLAMPHIMRDFHLGQDKVQLLATAFLAAGTASMLVAAWAAARAGIARSFVLALWLFGISSLLGALTPAGWFGGLLLARIGQGAAAGLIQPLAMMQLFAMYAPHERGKAMAAYGMGIVLSPAIGPVLSGVVVDHIGWRAVFVLTLPLCLLSGWLARRHLPGQGAPQRPQFDSVGLALLTLALVTLLDALPQLRHGDALAELAGGLALAAAFIGWQLRHPAPLLSPALFRHPRFAASAALSLAYGAGLYGSTFLVPLSLQLVAGFNGASTGLILLPSGLVLGLALQLGGHLTDKGWAIKATLAGLALFAVACLLLGENVASPLMPVWIAWTSLSRLGLGLIVPGLNQSAVGSVLPEQINQATAATNFLRQLGGALGVSLVSQFLGWREGLEPLPQAFTHTYMLTGALFVLALLPGWCMGRTGAAKPAQIG